MRQYFYELFCLPPFLVCLFRRIIPGTDSERRRKSDRNLWYFSIACTVLYFCHSLSFSSQVPDVPVWSPCLYLMCNLAVYPLFYRYGAEDMASDIAFNAPQDEREKIKNPPQPDILFSSVCEAMVEKQRKIIFRIRSFIQD